VNLVLTEDVNFFYTQQHICPVTEACSKLRQSCPSVRLSHAWNVSKQLNISSKFFHCLIGPSL